MPIVTAGSTYSAEETLNEQTVFVPLDGAVLFSLDATDDEDEGWPRREEDPFVLAAGQKVRWKAKSGGAVRMYRGPFA